jgi:hypothetical protein
MTIATAVLDGLASLGVPWWGWTALVVMIFLGLLMPDAAENAQEPEGAAPGGR